MALVNHTGQIADDNWSVLHTAKQPFSGLIPSISLAELLQSNTADKKVLLPIDAVLSDVDLMLEVLTLVQQHSQQVGVWLDAGHESAVTTQNLNRLLKLSQQADQANKAIADLSLIAIHISSFVDGRGFSLAEHLRLQGYTGEIRLSGAFGMDQLAYYQRSGVSSYLIADDAFSEDLLDGFDHLASAAAGKSVASLPMFR